MRCMLWSWWTNIIWLFLFWLRGKCSAMHGTKVLIWHCWTPLATGRTSRPKIASNMYTYGNGKHLPHSHTPLMADRRTLAQKSRGDWERLGHFRVEAALSMVHMCVCACVIVCLSMGRLKGGEAHSLAAHNDRTRGRNIFATYVVDWSAKFHKTTEREHRNFTCFSSNPYECIHARMR